MIPQLVMLAGPNGAGKSTFYDAFLRESPLPFLNADLFAKETGIDSFEAARVLDATRARMIDDRLGFITETVFSDPYGAKLGLLRAATEAGYDVHLIYIGVSDLKLALGRIDQRVRRGGHDVPRDRIAARFERSLDNLREAITFVPNVELYDNSLSKDPYREIARFVAGKIVWRTSGTVPAWCRSFLGPRAKKR